MSIDGVDKLIWAFIYGGSLVLCLGVFVQRQSDPWGWTLIVGGGVVAVAGALLVWVRSRMKG